MLTDTEKRYSQIHKEALSLILAVKKFSLHLKGIHFVLITDHKPLVSIFDRYKSVSTVAAGRLQIWALYLANFDYDIVYKHTTQHNNADGPSHLPIYICKDDVDVEADEFRFVNYMHLPHQPVNCIDIAEATKEDSVLSKVVDYILYGWPMKLTEDVKPYETNKNEYSVDGFFSWKNRIVIPPRYRQKIISEVHNGHMGKLKMKEIARNYVWWPGIRNDLEGITKSCEGCSTIKSSLYYSKLHASEWPDKPSKHWHIDFAGPVFGYMYVIFCRCLFKMDGDFPHEKYYCRCYH
jgi:hypothetical protein